jgi:pimeloyl-ACP methyl ester carboxylesterase
MTTVDDTLGDDHYDEFALLHENAEEWGLPFTGRPLVARHTFERNGSGQQLSFIRWGTEPPDVVFLHGGGQNAHTWDTAVLALGRPAISIDLPGHGHSARRDDKDYGPWANADAVADLLHSVLPAAGVTTGVTVVGMSLGGATTMRLASIRPDLCRRVVMIDVTPQINDPSREMTTMERGSVALIAGPPTYESFEEMAQAAIALSPFRGAAGVRRGVRHNSYRRPDGLWTWRYDLFGPWPEERPSTFDFAPLWDDVSRIACPAMFVRGGESKYVRDEDEEEMRRRLPELRVETVAGAGHAVQSDRPLDLVALLEDFITTT